MFHKLCQLMDPHLSKQCGFGKKKCTQHYPLVTLGKQKAAVEKGENFWALLADLSKFVDCLSHELLLKKLTACVFRIAALKLVESYLYQARSFLFSREKNDCYYDYDVRDDRNKFSFPLILICKNSNDE